MYRWREREEKINSSHSNIDITSWNSKSKIVVTILLTRRYCKRIPKHTHKY